MRAISTAFDGVLDSAVADSWLSGAMQHLATALPQVCQGLYLDVALRYSTIERRDDLMAALGVGGMKTFLDDDRDLAEALVLTGATTQATPMRAFVVAALESWGLDQRHLDALLAKTADGLELVLT